MKTYKPHNKTKTLWRIRSLVFLLCLWLVSGWFFSLTFYVLLALSVVAVLLVLFNALYLPAYLKNYSVQVSTGAVIIKSGVFIKKERIMPHRRLIYTERLTTPLAHLFSVSALTLRAARTVIFTLELDKLDIDEISGVLADG